MSKKRLPVVQSAPPPADDDQANASVLIWTSAGVVTAFLSWWPLSAIAAKLGTSGVPELAGASTAEEYAVRFAAMPEAMRAGVQARLSSLQLAALLLAHLLAGAFVARFSADSTLRQWTLVGLITGSLAALLALTSGGFSFGFFLPIPLAAAASAGGGWLLRRLRTRS